MAESFAFMIFTTLALLTQHIVLSKPRPEDPRSERHALDSADDGNDFIGEVARMTHQGSRAHSDLENNLIPRHVGLNEERRPPASPLEEDEQLKPLAVPFTPRIPPPPSSFRHSLALPTSRPRQSFLPTPPEFPTSYAMNPRREADQEISSFVTSDHRNLHPDAPGDLIPRQSDVPQADPLPEMVANQQLPLAPFQRIRAAAPSVGDWIARWIFRPLLSPFGV